MVCLGDYLLRGKVTRLLARPRPGDAVGAEVAHMEELRVLPIGIMPKSELVERARSVRYGLESAVARRFR